MSYSRIELKPGDVVLTTYGVAVVVKTHASEEKEGLSSFKARLWRVPSKSIASCANAYMRMDCVIKRLPAAPGMTTETLESNEENVRKVLIHSYSAYNDMYLVSKIDEKSKENERINMIRSFSRKKTTVDNDVETYEEQVSREEPFQLKSDKIQPSICAKFYPLIDELILRGNKATNSAKTTAKNIVKEAKASKKKSTNENERKEFNAKKVTNAINNSVPDSEDIHEVYKMLKDEELTVLLEKGRKRLQQLSLGGLNRATDDALKEMGVVINEDTANPTLLAQAQKKALNAIDELLAENLNVNLDAMKTSVGSTFGTMFDSLSAAAKSDGRLNSVLTQINEKTSEWQKHTGRLLDTKSSSLFLEGAQRIQSRVGNILSPQLLNLREESKASLTKAFTEGDVALAKLKSLELGDSVRSRLFEAIEARSESHGGLDGIIAGAVKQMGGDDVLVSIRSGSSSIATDAHESLISLLSERSKFHDISVMRLEQTLVNLESRLGKDMTAEQIASLARGEGGTSALFEPIAKNAGKEIEKQLDAAEESIEDPRILAVIYHIRKIMSGELTIANLFDEVTNILNNDRVVNVSATIAQRGEQILDAIETASENKRVSDLMSAVEKAGITKESVVEKFEKMNVNAILDTAEQAVSDEKKRFELLSSATDSALDFLLRVLPAMPVPPFEGVRDGLIYSIENLSMKGFRLKKEDIMVEIAGIKAAEQSSPNSTIVPSASGNDISVKESKSTDILIIDVRNISALLEQALWKFEKTSFPYVKGKGSANVNLSDGTIRLEFDLRKRKTENQGWEPVLSLHNSICTIGQIDLTIDGASGLTWVVNKLAAIFKGPLRNYVVKVIMDILKNKSGRLLQSLNGILSPHWDLILKTTGATLDDLQEANENDIIAAIPNPEADVINLVWTEFVPLGINLIVNDKSGMVKVKDFPRGSQARQVANKKGIDPDTLQGATILAVNGKYFDATERLDLICALREPERPKTVKLKLLRNDENNGESMTQGEDEKDTDNTKIPLKSLQILKEGPIGVEFCSSIDNYALAIKEFLPGGLIKITDTENLIQVGDILVSINNKKVIEGDGPWIQKSYEWLQKDGLSRPLRLDFIRPYLFKVVIKKEECDLDSDGPEELLLKEKIIESGVKRICLDGFRGVDGIAESSGVFIGDNLIFLNGIAVGEGTTLRPNCPTLSIEEVQSMLDDEESYPMCLHFARQSSPSKRKVNFDLESDNIKTFSVTILQPNQLGCKLDTLGSAKDKFFVEEFHAVPGSFNRIISSSIPKESIENLSFYSINEELLPSYASCNMVKNAMKRGWKHGELEIVFCDDKLKERLIPL